MGMKAQMSFITGTPMKLILVMIAAIGFLAFVTIGSGNITKFLQETCEKYPDLPFCGGTEVETQAYLTAKQSTEALVCAINSVAMGVEWSGDGKIDCRQYTKAPESSDYETVIYKEKNYWASKEECIKNVCPKFCKDTPHCTVVEDQVTVEKHPEGVATWVDRCVCPIRKPKSTVMECDKFYDDFDEDIRAVAYAGIFGSEKDLTIHDENRDRIGIALETEPCEEFANMNPKISVVTSQFLHFTDYGIGEVRGEICDCVITFDKALIPKTIFKIEGYRRMAEFTGSYLKVLTEKSDEKGIWSIDITGDDEADAYINETYLEQLGIQSVKNGATLPADLTFGIKIYPGTVDNTKWEVYFPQLGYIHGSIEIPITGILQGLASGKLECVISSANQFEIGQVYTTDYVNIIDVWKAKVGEKEYEMVSIDFTGDDIPDNLWYGHSGELYASNSNTIKSVFNIKEIKRGLISGATADLRIYHLGYTPVPDKLYVSAENELGLIWSSDIPVDDFLKGIESGHIKPKDIKPSNVYSVNAFGFFRPEADQTCKKMFDAMNQAEKSKDKVENLLAYRDMVLASDYIPVPQSYSCGEYLRGRNRYPIRARENDCSLKKSEVTCYVNNFNLPQDVSDGETARKFVKGLGDPDFVVYYEAFPQGEESAWMTDPDEFLLMSMVIGGSVNMIPVLGKAIGKGFAKATGKTIGAVLRGTFGKLLRFAFRKSGVTVTRALASLSDDVLTKVIREGMEESIEKAAKKAIGKELTESQARGLTRAIMNRVSKGMGPDEVIDDLARYYRLTGKFGADVDEKVLRQYLTTQVKTQFPDIVGSAIKNHADDAARALKNFQSDQAIDVIFKKETGESFADDFFRPVTTEMVEKNLEKEAIPGVLQKAIRDLAPAEKAIIKSNVKLTFRTAARKVRDLPADAWTYIRNNQKDILNNYLKHSMSLRYYALEGLDEAGVFPSADEIISDAEAAGIPVAKELAQCFLLVPGKWSKAACLFLQSAGVVSYIGDKANEKYVSHGLNTMVLHRTIYPEDVFDLASEAHDYYVQLKRPSNIWSGGGPQRLFFASPCKANLKVAGTMADCGLESCDYKNIAEKECDGKSGDDLKQCQAGVAKNVCGHLPASKEWSIGLPFLRKKFFSKETQYLSKYPLYLPGIPVASVDRDKYSEWSWLPEDAMGIKMCHSQSILREAWGSVKSSWVLDIITEPDIEPLKVETIEVEPVGGSFEGFCFQGDDHKEFLYKSLVFVGSVAVDIGVAALTVASLGAAAPAFFVTGAAAVYLDRKMEEGRMWPNNPKVVEVES